LTDGIGIGQYNIWKLGITMMGIDKHKEKRNGNAQMALLDLSKRNKNA
jgi:hypothetical protein